MKVGFLWFSRVADSERLAISQGAVAAAFPNADQRVVWDGNDGDGEVGKWVDRCDRISRFPRGGNLNGKECVAGMLMEMQRFAEECRLDWLIKIDSDVVACGSRCLRWMGSGVWVYGGLRGEWGEMVAAWGPAYAVSRKLLRSVPDGREAILETLEILDALGDGALEEAGWPEDQTMGRLAAFLYGEHRCYLEPTGVAEGGRPGGMLGLWRYDKYGAPDAGPRYPGSDVRGPTLAEVARYVAGFDFVECGRLGLMDWGVDDDDRRILSLAMMVRLEMVKRGMAPFGGLGGEIEEALEDGDRYSAGTYIDVGWHLGEGEAKLEKRYGMRKKGWRRVLIEPNPACFKALEAAGKGGAEIVHAAAGREDGVAWLRREKAKPAGVGATTCARNALEGLDAAEDALEVPMIRVSDYFDGNRSGMVVLKIDCEGAELDVIQELLESGAAELIDELYVEWHDRLFPLPAGEYAEDKERLMERLRECGVLVRWWD